MSPKRQTGKIRWIKTSFPQRTQSAHTQQPAWGQHLWAASPPVFPALLGDTATISGTHPHIFLHLQLPVSDPILLILGPISQIQDCGARDHSGDDRAVPVRDTMRAFYLEGLTQKTPKDQNLRRQHPGSCPAKVLCVCVVWLFAVTLCLVRLVLASVIVWCIRNLGSGILNGQPATTMKAPQRNHPSSLAVCQSEGKDPRERHWGTASRTHRPSPRNLPTLVSKFQAISTHFVALSVSIWHRCMG